MFGYSEYEQMDLGCSPCREDCVPLDRKVDYIPAMKAEVKRYKEMLEKRFPDWELYDCSFKVNRNPYDEGDYYDVAIRYRTTNEQSVDFALFVEGNCPERWSDEKVLRFIPDIPDADFEEQKKCPACSSTEIALNDGVLQCQTCGNWFDKGSYQNRSSKLTDFKVTYDNGTSYVTSANGTLEEFRKYLMQDGGVVVEENPATGVETRRQIVNVEWLPKAGRE